MKKRTKKILSMMLAAATAMSLTNFALAEEETEGKTQLLYPSILESWEPNNGYNCDGYSWVGSFDIEMALQFVTGDNSGIRVKSAELEMKLVNNSGWKYEQYVLDTAGTPTKYIAGVNALYKNKWVQGKGASYYVALTDKVVKDDKKTVTFEKGETSATATVDITDMVKKGIADGKVSLIVNKEGADVFTFNKDSGTIKLHLTYMTDTEFLPVINAATTENIDDIIAELDTAHVNAYKGLVHKESIRSALVGDDKTYESVDAFAAAFETAYESYMQNPEEEDLPGKTKTVKVSLYGKGDTKNQTDTTIGNDYVSLGSYGCERALLKFDVKDINRDYVKKATLKYSLKDSFQNWYTYDKDKDYSARVDGVSSEWKIGDDRSSNINKSSFIENEKVATSYKLTEMDTYAIYGADITEDFKTRTLTDGNISYMLQREESYSCVIASDCTFEIEVEYINDYELLQLINQAETAEKIGEILESGLFADDATYKKYAKLNSKTRINTALIPTGDGYASLDAFNTAFESAYTSYMQTPDEEDKAGKTAMIKSNKYGHGDTGNQDLTTIQNSYADMQWSSTRVLIKFPTSDINRDYVKKATLTYRMSESKFSRSDGTYWWAYSPEADYYSAIIDGVSSDWELDESTEASTYYPENSKRENTINKAGFTEKENITTSYKLTEMNTYAVMAADITEDFKTRALGDDKNISYMLRRNASDGKTVVIDEKGEYTIVLEYINGYELLQKYNTVKNDSTALSAFITEVAKIEGKTKDIEPEIAAMVIGGKEFSSYDALLAAIVDASAGGMAVTDETVSTETAGTITGTFSICNFNEGEETDTVYAIVAGYNSTSNEMLASYIVKNGDGKYEIEVDQATEGDDGIKIGKTASLSFELTDADSKIDLIKVYLWKNFTTMSPYAEAKELKIEN